jgi:hypothetical protein
VNFKLICDDINIICPIHGFFTQQATAHQHGFGCKKCGIIRQVTKRTKTIDQFIIDSELIHGSLYDYSLLDYKNSNTNVKIICKTHGIFELTPLAHLCRVGCQKCGTRDITLEEFIEEANNIHSNYYDYSKVTFRKISDKISIICPKHGEFPQAVRDHIYKGCGCAKCSKRVSKGETQWLDTLGIIERQYYLTLNNSKKHVDGYDPNTNTVYEYYGDFWHGNPTKYNQSEINPRAYKTYGELYLETLNREVEIRKSGYNLIVIWESEWKKISKSSSIASPIIPSE